MSSDIEMNDMAGKHKDADLVEVEEGISVIHGGNAIITSIDRSVNWSRKNSLWPMTFGLACCAMEMIAGGSSDYDFDRFVIVFRASPL